MSHADWAADFARRAREKVQRAREIAEAGGGQEELTDEEEEEEEEEVPEVPAALPPKVRAFPPHPQFAGWASQGGSPSGYSPSPSPRWSASPLYVPAYVDGDPHGGFNPNVVFAALPPHGYAGSPAHRRALPFASGGDARADARTLFGGTQGDSFMPTGTCLSWDFFSTLTPLPPTSRDRHLRHLRDARTCSLRRLPRTDISSASGTTRYRDASGSYRVQMPVDQAGTRQRRDDKASWL